MYFRSLILLYTHHWSLLIRQTVIQGQIPFQWRLATELLCALWLTHLDHSSPVQRRLTVDPGVTSVGQETQPPGEDVFTPRRQDASREEFLRNFYIDRHADVIQRTQMSTLPKCHYTRDITHDTDALCAVIHRGRCTLEGIYSDLVHLLLLLCFLRSIGLFGQCRQGLRSRRISSDSSPDSNSGLEISTPTPAPTPLRLRLTATFPF